MPYNTTPTHIEILLNSAYQLLQFKKYQPALSCYSHILKLEPNNLEAKQGYADVLLESGRYEEALAAYDQITLQETLAKNELEEALRLTGIFVEDLDKREYSHLSNSFQKVYDTYYKFIELQECFGDAHYGRGEALYSLGRFEEALAAYNRAIELDTDIPQAHQRRNEILKFLNRSETPNNPLTFQFSASATKDTHNSFSINSEPNPSSTVSQENTATPQLETESHQKNNCPKKRKT